MSTFYAGGTSIEELAEKFPEKIVKVPVDVRKGVTDEQANRMVEGLGVTGDKPHAVKQIKGLYELFTKRDCTMVEVSPTGSDAAPGLPVVFFVEGPAQGLACALVVL